jgi:transposase-like protein
LNWRGGAGQRDSTDENPSGLWLVDPIAGCRRRLSLPLRVIIVAVRWYLRIGLCYRDVEEVPVERGVEVDHVTIYRWVLASRRCWTEAARPCRHLVGGRWQVDETYVKVAGRWYYVYRAIDQLGQVVDVYLSPRRDAKAARRSFERAIGTTKVKPGGVVTDRAPTYPMVLDALLPAAQHRTDRYAQPGRGRPRPSQGKAAADARLAAGPQRQDRDPWACVRPECSPRPLRAGG